MSKLSDISLKNDFTSDEVEKMFFKNGLRIIKEQSFKVLSLNLNSMDIEVIEYEGTKKKVTKMPFA